MSDWTMRPLGEVATVFDGPHATPTKTDAGPWYLSISSLQNGRFDLAASAHLSEADFPRWTKRVSPRVGDTLFSYETRIGEAAYWNLDVRAALGRRMGLLRPKSDEVNARFLSYAFLGPQFQKIIRAKTVHGATVERLLIADMPAWPILLPPFDEQRRIAAVLGTLDDLIEANRRTIAASLELAAATFDQLTSRDLPSTSLIHVTTKIGSGATPRGGKEVYQDDGVAFIRSQNVYNGRFEFDGLARISDSAADALRGVTVSPGDVLINITGESVGRTARVPEQALPARVSQHVVIVRPDATVLDHGYLLLALLSGAVQAHLHGLSTAGATRRALTKSHLEATTIPLPALMEQRRIATVLDVVEELEAEISNLTRTRDELLPLLMSGKVLVSEDLAVA
jgi:type I restriction enzyme S subunit